MTPKVYACTVTNPKHFAVAVAGATVDAGETKLPLTEPQIKALKASVHGIEVKKGKEVKDASEPEAPAEAPVEE